MHMGFHMFFSYIVSSRVQHEESLEVRSWDIVGRLLTLEGMKAGIILSILSIGIDPHIVHPSSQA